MLGRSSNRSSHSGPWDSNASTPSIPMPICRSSYSPEVDPPARHREELQDRWRPYLGAKASDGPPPRGTLAQAVDWDDVRHFLALARTGSVRAAGATLGVSHSTVARRVESLETRLGAKLFDRHRDGYLLTEAGHEMVAGAERVEREMAALERGLAGQDARLEGPVRVTCTDPFIAKILLRALAGLCAQHPGIELELDADARNLDLSKREADVALRALLPTAAPPEHLIGRRLVPITLCNYVGRAHAGRLEPEAGPLRWLGSNRTRSPRSWSRRRATPSCRSGARSIRWRSWPRRHARASAW